MVLKFSMMMIRVIFIVIIMMAVIRTIIKMIQKIE